MGGSGWSNSGRIASPLGRHVGPGFQAWSLSAACTAEILEKEAQAAIDCHVAVPPVSLGTERVASASAIYAASHDIVLTTSGTSALATSRQCRLALCREYSAGTPSSKDCSMGTDGLCLFI